MEILRFITAGSVDDGKSTLIGRLLFETGNISRDEFELVQSKYKTDNGKVDFSRFTDGLADERAKGITIDIAFRYFFTEKRKYIIADSPGHFEYTRNMFTAASNADAAIVLVDARHGVTEQTYRHSLILALLKVKNVVYAVNKMDCYHYEEKEFLKIKSVLDDVGKRLKLDSTVVPVSALEGENLIQSSRQMPWYSGPCLLSFLEKCQPKSNEREGAVAMVQLVVQSENSCRVFAKFYGSFRHKEMVVLPAGKSYSLVDLWTGGVQGAIPSNGQNISFELPIDTKIARGDLLVENASDFVLTTSILVKCCHFSEIDLFVSKRYLLKIGTQETIATVEDLMELLNPATGELNRYPTRVRLNDFAWLRLHTEKPLVLPKDHLEELRQGILIEIETNFSCSAFLVDENGF